MDPRRKARLAGLALLAPLLAASCGQPRTALAPPADPGLARLVIDTRLPDAFAAGHEPGALNLQWDWGQLDARVAAYVPDKETPLALRATSSDEAALAAGLLVARGYTNVTLPPRDEPDVRLVAMTAVDLASALSIGAPITVLDVREGWEHALGTVPGAVLVDPDRVPAAVAELEPDVVYAVICERGYRSSQMASWMQRAGFTVSNVIDGMAGWRALPAELRAAAK